MHDIRLVRSDPDAFDAALAKRGASPAADAILALDEERRAVQTRMQEGQTRRNEASKAIGKAMGQGDTATAEALKAEVAGLKETLPSLEAEEKALSAKQADALAALPNLPADDVPQGADENDNVEVSRWGTPREFDFEPQEHADFAPALGLDFETAAEISGARFVFMRGQMARLNRALGAMMLDMQTAAGFVECVPPLLVKDDALFGTGQLPKFAEDLFRTTDDKWLIPTAEVSLTNAVREQILDPQALPMKLTALTPCFRSEAGAAGKDTRGLIRQHQFDKVELVAITAPDQSEAMHEAMCTAAEAVLQALDLPYRKVLLCTGDMSFSARKTYDLEVWLPGQNTYREISSISNCGDFQARRMNARFKPEGSKKTEFVHTLNGSGLAVGRTLVAVLENGQNADGSVTLPSALVPYMGGIDKLEPA
ncbi:serine--tRNA ligase [Croceicoccus naphthovorans]|uniref:Serine--tRNA ligase n=1 Tax=Croceicoccus naphthovorans TaxID=1348774 RepID=A0A0G3XFA5_9SPHN|nr:serine--tRNA ligase [Croceicoccus naphthovorans]AKM10205.1 serine--tRNA ligase [Croceicoccus naphthovorans]MBB3990543.1 seryl-tRNA synthetase [Croceicoccus naphthovorans]